MHYVNYIIIIVWLVQWRTLPFLRLCSTIGGCHTITERCQIRLNRPKPTRVRRLHANCKMVVYKNIIPFQRRTEFVLAEGR